VNADAQIEAALEALTEAMGDDARPGLEPFLAGVDEADRPELYGELLAQALVARSSRDETPWIGDYLTPQTCRYGGAVCRALTARLFAGDAAPAARLGVRDFGDFVATGVLGFGGFGTVLRGHHRRDRAQAVAVKIAHAGPGPAGVLLDNEAQSLRIVQSLKGVPTLVRETSVTPDGRKYLVMGLIEGVPLDRWLADPRNDDRAARLDACRQLVRVVAHLHRAGLVHGDLTPANALVAGTPLAPRVTLVDFGNCNFGLQPNPLRVLTHRYAAPELLLGLRVRPSVETDGWSLGVLVHEVLGGYPFGRIPPDATDGQLGRHFSSGRTASLPDDLPAPLVQAVRDCLIVDPADRSGRMSLDALLAAIPGPLAYADHLRSRAGGSASPTPQPPAALPTAQTAAAPVPEVAPPDTDRPTRRRQERIALGGGRVGASAAAGAVAALVAVAMIVVPAAQPNARNRHAEVPASINPTSSAVPVRAARQEVGQGTTEEEAFGRVKQLQREADEVDAGEPTIDKCKQILQIVADREAMNNSLRAAEWSEIRCHTVNRLGLSYQEAERWDEAERQFNELLRLAPAPCHWRGTAYVELGNLAAGRASRAGGDTRTAANAAAAGFYQYAVNVYRHPAVGETSNAELAERRLRDFEAQQR
jgi:predicted Ser/Thr protein kinase